MTQEMDTGRGSRSDRAGALASFEVDAAAREAMAEHLLALMEVDATSGQEEAIVEATAALCARLDLPVRRLPVEPGRDNLSVGPEGARVLLCTHLDTVPPHIPARREGDVLYGRGACDALGCAVSMLHALRMLREAGYTEHVACLLVIGEETDHAGARAVARGHDARPEHIILGEPCGLHPAVGQKGLLKVRLHATGLASHSAYPEQGSSAVHHILDALQALRDTPLPADPSLGETTVNVGTVHGGVAPNVIAPEAEAVVLARCAAPVDAVLGEIEGRLPPGVTCEELGRAEPFEFLADERLLGVGPGAAVPFNTDAHSLAPLGAKMTLMGPGDMRCAHADGEQIAVGELADGATAYARVAARLG